jgi:hypothetical protein
MAMVGNGAAENVVHMLYSINAIFFDVKVAVEGIEHQTCWP